MCGEEPESAGEGVRAFLELVEGFLIDVHRADVVPHQDTQVDGFIREGE